MAPPVTYYLIATTSNLVCQITEPSGSFSPKALSTIGMDDFFLKRVLFEWVRDRLKEQAHAEITSLKEMADRVANLLIFQR